ncbi:MAG: hypothetical protein SGI72_15165 [Planctomycetota bacterium]|nr:hypothetical protein [Planctomycetota bacterium]
MIGSLEFARPSLLALSLVVLIVLWFARRAAAHPLIDATGTLEIWKRATSEKPRSAPKPRIPPAVWWLAAALVSGVVALAGPRTKQTSSSNSLLVVVDRSPSMYLSDGTKTRLAHALSIARTKITALAFDEVTWIAPPYADDEAHASNTFRDEWLEAPRFDVAEPDPATYDRANVLFVTDHSLQNRLKKAGFCASGGPAVSGPIGVDGDHILVFDGVSLKAGALVPQRTVHIAAGVAERIVRITEAWASARGFQFEPGFVIAPVPDSAALTVYGSSGPSAHEVDVQRDGWNARATAVGPLPTRDSHGSIVNWLTSTSGECVVASAPGRVHIALRTIDEPRGDPAAWPVSWSRLFDESVSLPRGCVSIAERSSAGDPAVRDPGRPLTDGPESIGPWTALAAACATVCALVAVWLASSTQRTPASGDTISGVSMSGATMNPRQRA